MPIPEEKHYAPVGAYNFSIDENGLFTIVPTYRADRTVTVTKPEEYINPEFIITPRSVKPLVDDTGKPAYSVDAYNIVLEEKHKPLNPYQYYMESKGVAPKDVETEHLMQRYRSNLAAERANLSPFIANLLTGMYATAAQEGWNNIKNGKYFTGAAEVLSPLMFGEDAWNKVAQGIYGGIQLLNENGVPKTWEEIKRGNYGRAALSGAGDLFNLTLAGIGGNLIYRSTLGHLNSSKGTIIRTVLPNGKIRLSLPSHTDSAPRQFVLEPAPEGNNKYYVHMRIWDDPKNKVPGNITNAEKQQLFEALYNELPEGAEILFPESGPGNYATRGTIAGLMRLSRDPRFRPGSPGVLLYNDRGTIKTFNGTSFIKDSKASRIRDIRGIEGTPKITEENAMLISPEEWNRQFRAAEARGDIEEGLRLRILYSMIKHPDDMTSTNGRPVYFFHSTEEPLTFNAFDLSRTGLNFSEEIDEIGSDRFGRGGAWFSAKIPDDSYGEYNRRFLLHLKNSEFGEGDLLMPEDVVSNIDNLDGVIGRFERYKKEPIIAGETIVFDPKKIKLADAFTYDNSGNLIPLSLRDDLTVDDIRYFYNQSQYPNVSIRGRVPTEEYNPLDIRIQRMMERAKLKEENPEMYNLIYGEKSPFDLPQLSVSVLPRTTNYNIKRAMLDIDPSLTLEDLDTAAQIVMANKGGVHFNIYNNSGDVMGGVSMVDIQDAVNLVRKLNGREALPYDISMIAGHEYGHGVNLPKEALEAIKGYYAPEEFYTQAGQILDNAGLIHTSTNPISFNKFMSLLDKYLQKGNLDNGISKMKKYLLSTNPMLRLKIMKNINRFSVGVLGMFGVSLLAKK